ncbi:thioredoxin fold domain-containing protein [Thermosulfurimonas sp. F29]|uniref:thioredoxin fold domain-containing protein n=1 Tax=Thermosulfurimonas sp. F29 TaxID=2867247 RepID=UPI001C83509F|nr:thioredoxin fold domain-containing protein [Thermosulfurimonas sp. F29]MBX6424267.1 thioredoxin fold domain-containing protein [Thermosulfurimonas sp. F29]
MSKAYRIGMVIVMVLLSVAVLWPGSIRARSSCPQAESVEQALLQIWPRARGRLRVERVRPLKEWPDFCEAAVSFGGPFRSFVYIHRDGHFAFVGQLLDLKKGENITRKHMASLKVLNPIEILRLEGAVGYIWGESGGKSVYFIMDPDCPFCKRMLPVLESLVNKKLIRVKVIYYPLEKIHPDAGKKAISLICDQKSPLVLLKEYKPGNMCEEGRKKIEYAKRVLRSLNITAVPVLIRPDGRMLKGQASAARIKTFLLK